MSKSESQNLKNHARFDPPFHFFLTFVFLGNLIVAIVYLVHHLCFYSAWLVLLSVALILAVLKLRQYPIKVQDRVIRLEERLRLQALAPAGVALADLSPHGGPVDRAAFCRRR